jgi:hypothetical protein
MRAVVLQSPSGDGENMAVREVAAPQPGPGEVLVRTVLLSLDPATFPRPTTLSAKSPRTLNSLPSTLNSSPTPLEFCIAPTLASH